MRLTRPDVERPASNSTRSTRPPAASTVGPADDLVEGPVGALDEDVGNEGLDDSRRSGLVVEDDSVHGLEREEGLGPLGLWISTGRLGALEAANRGVGVQGHDEDVERPRAASRRAT